MLELMRAYWVGLVGLVLLGCGDDDSNDNLPNCGTIQNPDLLELADVEPAAGSSVPNQNIVHRFTIVGSVGVEQPALGFSPVHTAGEPAPAFAWSRLAGSLQYTSNGVTWANAPATVEIESAAKYQAPDGCVYAFPTPMFAYEITAP
jgi:hypothetical protein